MAEQGFTLSTTAFQPDGNIPAIYTCDGRNHSPELNWMKAPADTQSFALIIEDPDAPNGTFTHWVLFDIPAGTSQLPTGSAGVGVEGRNDFHYEKYGGPCPPPNHGEHRYYFRLFALDVATLDLQRGASRQQVERAMEGHVLDQAELMGLFARTTG